MSKDVIRKTVRYTLIGLPLAGVAGANLLNISAVAHQFLVLIVLLWFQVFIFFEVFSGK
jgi:hypothetical protein